MALTPLTCICQVPGYVPTSGLMLYYGFNGNANDLSGNGINGIVSGPSYTADRFGNSNAAVHYTGTGERITTQHIDRTATNTFSYSVWVNTSTSATIPTQGSTAGLPTAESYTCVIAPVNGWNWSTSSAAVAAGLNVASNGVYVTEHGVGITNVALSWSGTLGSGWHHVVIVYESSQPALYVDGSFIKYGLVSLKVVHPSMACDSYSTGPTTFPYITAGFGHGLYVGTVPTYNFTGDIDDIAIYNRALTPCEITQLYDTVISPLSISGSSLLCAGSTTTLTASSPGGSWMSSSGSVATVGTGGVVTGITAGAAVITYTTPTGCSTTKAITVSPIPFAISGPTHICPGSSGTLSFPVSGGVWSSVSGSVAAIGSLSGFVTGLTAGSSIISYAVSLSCGMAYPTTTVTIDATPTITGGATAICNGSSVSLSAVPAGGVWSSTSSYVSVNSTSGAVSGLTAGVSTITYTASTGCTSVTTVSTNPLPSLISGGTTVCVGATSLLSDATPGGAWSSSAPVYGSVGSVSGIVSGLFPGMTAISYTLPTGCAASTTVTVITAPAPPMGLAEVCEGSTVTLYGSPGGGVWSAGGSGVSVGSASGVVTGVSSGAVAVSYSISSGCESSIIVTVDPIPAAITGALGICSGSTSTLADATPLGYWTSSDIATAYADIATGDVSGFATGTATITYTLPTGCYTTAVVSVNSAPTVIIGSGSICVGTTSTLFDGVAGGIWSSSNPFVAAVDTASGVCRGLSAGVATISYFTGVGCYATMAVSVNPIPLPITGTARLCQGTTTTLSDATPGGRWSSTAGSVATVSSTGVVTGVSGGITTISYSAGGSCAATIVVTVDPLPGPITGITRLCPNTTTTLSSTPGSGTWTSSNTSIATIGSASGTLTGVASGTVTVVFTSATTGCSASAVATVDPLPAAIAGPGTVCTGQAISLSSSPSGGTWSRSNGNINVSSSGLTLGISAGTANVTYTLPVTGCFTTKTVTVNVAPAGITGTMNVCVGGSTDLSTGSGTGTWTSSNTAVATIGSAGVLNALATGTTVITNSLSSGCAATATITVNPLPIPYTITGGGGMCAGGTGLHIGLSGSATGTSYALYRGGTATGTTLAGTGSSIDFGPQITGIYTVIANTTISGCTNNMTGSVTVSLNPTPVISGPTAVCAGATATLSAVPGGTWSSGSPGIVTIGSSTGIVTGIAIGSAAITCFPVGGCIAVTTMNVTSAPSAITGASTVCVGATTILISSPSGGVWTSSNISKATVGSMNGMVTGVATGNATITYSLGGGCNTMTTINVVPSPAAITGAMNVCSGGTTALTTTTGGGSWSSGATGVATVSGSGIVTGGTGGTATISYTVSGCSSTAVVTVNAIPPAIGGPAFLCQGSTAAETNTMSGGVWTTSSAGIGITGAGTTAIITGISAGAAAITYNVSGCSTTKTITVNTAPAITGTRTLCTGNSTTLTTGVSGSWSSGASGIATITASGLVTAVSAGIAPVTFTPPTGCIATTTITVNSTPPPITGPANVCAGSTAGYTAAGGSWVSSNASVATIGSASGILTAVSPGVVTITCPPTGCSSSLTVTVNALPAAITGSSTLCAGTTTALASTTPGGIWNSSSTPIATVGSSTGVVTGITADTANISYAVNGCSVTKTITVTAIPSISGSNHVCLGGTVTLTPGTAGGTWSSSNPVVASVGSGTGIVTGASLGNATISYSLGPGCTQTTSMTVDPLPAAISGGTNICVGRTVTLSDATPGGAWSSATAFASVNSATGVVTGLAGGAALISYTGPNGCASAATINVIQLQPIMGIHPLCAWGDTMTVSNADTTGIYTSTFATVLNIGHGGGIVTARVPGISTVTYTIPLGCTITAQLTINPLPAGISGTLDICPGGTTTLSDVSAGGAWSSITPAVASIGAASGTATAIAAGTTRIVYTLPTGCKADTLLTVTAPPAAGSITGRNNLCIGSTTLLAAGATGGVWSSGMPSIATISTVGVITGVATGTATIAYTVSNLCGTDAVQATVNVYPAVVAGIITGLDTICAGNSTILADTATGGAWASTNTGIASVGSTGEVLGLLAGTDTITFRVANPGCAAMATHTIEVLPHAICGLNSSQPSPLKTEVLRAWPNPNDGTFSITVSSAVSEEIAVVIFDITGRGVYHVSIQSNEIIPIHLNVAPGIYFISAATARGMLNSKVEVRELR